MEVYRQQAQLGYQGLLSATPGITHQLTASNAISASYAAAGGTATTAATASFVTGSNVYGPHGSNSVLSSSFATTASYATAIAPGLGGEWKNETTYISSSLPIKVDGHITASGNISASGNIKGNGIASYGAGTGFTAYNDSDSFSD